MAKTSSDVFNSKLFITRRGYTKSYPAGAVVDTFPTIYVKSPCATRVVVSTRTPVSSTVEVIKPIKPSPF